MEHLFLTILVLIMIAALASGFPVAFALPGSAIISIGLAAFFGYLFEGDVSAYYATDGPKAVSYTHLTLPTTPYV